MQSESAPPIDFSEKCYVRASILSRRARTTALDDPPTRRLLVSSAGYYVDDEHLHFFDQTRGLWFTRVYVCVGGSGWMRIRGRTRALVPGTVLVVPRLESHLGQPNRAGWTLWWCDLLGTDVLEILAAAGIDADEPVMRSRDPHAIVALVQRILDLYESGHDPARILEAAGLGWALLLRLSVERRLPGSASPLDRALDYIAAHLEDEIRVADVAAHVGISSSRVQTLFRESLGKGVLAYQTESRMTRARRLLAETQETVAQIGRQVGYGDPYYFSRQFRRVNGVSPSAFRKRAD